MNTICAYIKSGRNCGYDCNFIVDININDVKISHILCNTVRIYKDEFGEYDIDIDEGNAFLRANSIETTTTVKITEEPRMDNFFICEIVKEVA